MHTAIKVVPRYRIMISIVMLPIFLVLIMDAVPTTIEQNTNGTTNIFIKFMNAVDPK
jgi:hypothetical protein